MKECPVSVVLWKFLTYSLLKGLFWEPRWPRHKISELYSVKFQKIGKYCPVLWTFFITTLSEGPKIFWEFRCWEIKILGLCFVQTQTIISDEKFCEMLSFYWKVLKSLERFRKVLKSFKGLKSFERFWKVLQNVVILYGQVSSVSNSFYSPTMSWIFISIEFLNMFPTKFFCFRDSVLPPRSPTVLTLCPNMFLASNFIGLILLATSQLFVPLVQGDRVSDALDSGKAVFLAFYIWWPGSVLSKQKCVTSKPCKNT